VKKDPFAVAEVTFPPLAALLGCGLAQKHCCCPTWEPADRWVTGPAALNTSPAPAGKPPNRWELLLGFLLHFTS